VVLAGLNDGKYLENGLVREIHGCELFRHYFEIDVPSIGMMEVYTNRDSLPFLDLYTIPEAKSVFRGTIRYQGWCDLWAIISNLGFLSSNERNFSKMTYKRFTKELINFQSNVKSNDLNDSNDNLKESIRKIFNLDKILPIPDKLEWLGLFSEKLIRTTRGGNIDVLVELLLEKLSYQDNERDMVILQDELVADYDGTIMRYKSTLIDYGVAGEATSIARTVGLPAACAAKLILGKKISLKGVHIPVHPEIYKPILSELKTLGIMAKEEERDASYKQKYAN
jgi:saccharopine dehydrogenase-like NADP-dependent oxidoreductase